MSNYVKENELLSCPFCGAKLEKTFDSVSQEYCFTHPDNGCVIWEDHITTQKDKRDWNSRVVTNDIVDKISQELQDAGFEDASKWLDCAYEL